MTAAILALRADRLAAAPPDFPQIANFGGGWSPPSGRWRILGGRMLHHVTREIPPALLAQTVGFYERLGFVEVPTPAGIGARARWLELGGTQIHLMPVAGAGIQPGHVAVILPAYAETLEALRGAGHAVEPRREHWGSPRSYVRDPAGNLVEVMRSPPPRSPPLPRPTPPYLPAPAGG